MGYLPQEESIFRKMTVEQNIMAILETLPMSKTERRVIVAISYCTSSGSSESHMIRVTLSGGEKRRLTSCAFPA